MYYQCAGVSIVFGHDWHDTNTCDYTYLCHFLKIYYKGLRVPSHKHHININAIKITFFKKTKNIESLASIPSQKNSIAKILWHSSNFKLQNRKSSSRRSKSVNIPEISRLIWIRRRRSGRRRSRIHRRHLKNSTIVSQNWTIFTADRRTKTVVSAATGAFNVTISHFRDLNRKRRMKQIWITNRNQNRKRNGREYSTENWNGTRYRWTCLNGNVKMELNWIEKWNVRKKGGGKVRNVWMNECFKVKQLFLIIKKDAV